jgi:hypothetical protein
MLSVIVQNVVKLNVVMLSVVAPDLDVQLTGLMFQALLTRSEKP